MTADELERWLADTECPQRTRLEQLRSHVATIRALDDAAFQRVVRAIKKRLSSPKLAGELAALLHDVADGRATKPVETARPEPAAVAWVGTVGLDEQAHALEAAIAADPEAQGPYTVLGDYWTSTGDVRGELISVGHALAKNPMHKVMRAAWTKLLADHHRLLWGEVAGIDQVVRDVDWYMGFIRGCRIEDRHDTDARAIVAALLDDPGPGRFLQHLVLGAKLDIASMLAHRPRPTLRRLVIEHHHNDGAELSALWAAVPQLRELRLETSAVGLGELRLPVLERFALDFGPLAAGEQPLDFLAPLWAGDGVPDLRALALTNCSRTDELCAALVRSPLAERLVEIDLALGTMTAVGAAALHAHRDRFVRVKRWNFELNYLDAAACALVGELRGAVVGLEDQRTDHGHRHGFEWE